MKTMMAEDQVHPDVIAKLWQAYGEFQARKEEPELYENYALTHESYFRDRTGNPKSTTSRCNHYPGYAGACEARNHDRKGRNPVEDRSRTVRKGQTLEHFEIIHSSSYDSPCLRRISFLHATLVSLYND